MNDNLIARPYAYTGRGSLGIAGAIDWNAILNGLIASGVSIYTAQQQINAAKAAQAATIAAGQQYSLPGNLSPYAGGGMSNYMPYIIGGVALIALLLIMKK